MTVKSFLQTFNLALGLLVALVIGAFGALLLYAAWVLQDGTFWLGVFGGCLVLLSAVMMYRRVTILGVLEALPWTTWN